jgi:serine/threonine protein kinase
MDEIFFEIKKSSINIFTENELYKIEIIKKIGSGSYGYVFISSFYNLVVKILDGEDKGYYTDKSEYDICNHLIESKDAPELFCKYYAIGHITKSYTFNEPDVKVFPKYSQIILMPYYVSFDKYLGKVNRYVFAKEVYLCNLALKILESQLYFFNLGYINLDIKFANIMFDFQDKIKLIDFGMCKYRKKLDDKIEILDKYYIWPLHKNVTYDKLIPYMVGILLLEIIFGSKVYSIKSKGSSYLTSLLIEIQKSIQYSKEFKKLLYNIIHLNMNLSESIEELKTIIVKYQFNICKDTPNIYSSLSSFEDIKNFDTFN